MDSKNIEIHFAPLQGYTDYVYRNLHYEYFGAIDNYYTPFIRLEKNTFRTKDLRDIEPIHNLAPVTPQLIAATPSEFLKVSECLAEKGYENIDINLGCPHPPMAARHKGAVLLAHPSELLRLLKTVEQMPHIRFSLKLRLGWDDPDDTLRLISFFEHFPFHHITIHARTAKQQYKGHPDENAFTRIYDSTTLPLFYNGDITTIEDIARLIARYPRLQGVMIGRGLLANPLLAYEYKKKTITPIHVKREKYYDHHRQMYARYAELFGETPQLLLRLKEIWQYHLSHTDKKLRKHIFKSRNLIDYNKAVERLIMFSDTL